MKWIRSREREERSYSINYTALVYAMESIITRSAALSVCLSHVPRNNPRFRPTCIAPSHYAETGKQAGRLAWNRLKRRRLAGGARRKGSNREQHILESISFKGNFSSFWKIIIIFIVVVTKGRMDKRMSLRGNGKFLFIIFLGTNLLS